MLAPHGEHAAASRYPPSNRWERATPCGRAWNCSQSSAALRKRAPDVHTGARAQRDLGPVVPLIWAGSPCNHSTPGHRCNLSIPLWNKRELVAALPPEVGMECGSHSVQYFSFTAILCGGVRRILFPAKSKQHLPAPPKIPRTNLNTIPPEFTLGEQFISVTYRAWGGLRPAGTVASLWQCRWS